MTTDYRALCAELLEALEIQLDDLALSNRLCKRARTVLSQPQHPAPCGHWNSLLRQHPPVGAFCEYVVLNEWAVDQGQGKWYEQADPAVSGFASPSLGLMVSPPAQTIWRLIEPVPAQPDSVEPTDAAKRVIHYLEQRRMVRGLEPDVIHALHAGTDEPRQATLTVSDLEALARYGRPTITPIPVSERPWERDGFCDAEDTCWAIGQRDNWVRVYVPGRDWSNPAYSHCLPAHALPLPCTTTNTP